MVVIGSLTELVGPAAKGAKLTFPYGKLGTDGAVAAVAVGKLGKLCCKLLLMSSTLGLTRLPASRNGARDAELPEAV